MQVRQTAVVLPLEMLIDVNIEPMLKDMTKLARTKNKNFDLTKAVRDKVLALLMAFDCSKITKEDFAKQVLALFGLQGKKRSTFYSKWNKAINTGFLQEGLGLLQQYSKEHNVLFYLYGEMNSAHFEQLKLNVQQMGLHLQSQKLPAHAGAEQFMLEGMPLCLSFQQKAVRARLVEKQIKAHQSKWKDFNAVTVVADSPYNYELEDIDTYLPEDPIIPFYRKMQEITKIDTRRIATLCKLNNMQLLLHGGDLRQSLQQLSHTEVGVEQTQRLGM